jgi:hypothetical protein
VTTTRMGRGVRQPWSYGIECVVRLYLARVWPPVRLLNLLPAFWTVVAVILLFSVVAGLLA